MTTTEPTVESCLKELREMFSGRDSRVEAQEVGWVNHQGRIRKVQRVVRIHVHGELCGKGATLSEAMARVRRWHSEQAKES